MRKLAGRIRLACKPLRGAPRPVSRADSSSPYGNYAVDTGVRTVNYDAISLHNQTSAHLRPEFPRVGYMRPADIGVVLTHLWGMPDGPVACAAFSESLGSVMPIADRKSAKGVLLAKRPNSGVLDRGRRNSRQMDSREGNRIL